MSDKPLFENMDEQERVYAPQELPSEERDRVRADEGSDAATPSYEANEPPAAAPVANIGSSPSSSMAPPNIGHSDHGGAPGDPETEAEYPIGDNEHNERR